MRIVVFAVALAVAISSCRSKESPTCSGPCVSAIAVGNRHACAVVSGGAVKCWGDNSYGELGSGTTTSSTVPVGVLSLTGATAIGAGSDITCAIVTGGTVWCWGDNFNGQLGTGSPGSMLLVPGQVLNLSGVASIGIGAAHACAIAAGGTVECWGSNGDGELGDGTTIDKASPVSVRASSDPSAGSLSASAVTAGYAHTCALLSGGTAKCWGSNANCQLGIPNTTTTSSTVPVEVTGLTGATAISAGDRHNCALLGNGTVSCWGSNGRGQLGSASVGMSDTLISPDLGVATAIAVAAADMHSCALMSGGTVKCWGDNSYGELGNGTTITSANPVDVKDLTGATAIVAGALTTCALLEGGSVKCWGSNQYGELGNPGVPSGSPSNYSTVPVDVAF